ncbi:glycosyltransferase family 4 protein [Thalassotalea maritima]|uniref:glycosyltransferase family 4 protein n=1 Tax=Thalassotalea maritima TaxID=3242416 RepID=UPI003528A9F6
MANKKRKLVIVQPALGRYRKGFINSLVKLNDTFNISIFCSPVDNSGVKSMRTIDNSIVYRKVNLTSLFGVFFWQSLVIEITKLKLTKGDALVINGNPRFISSLIVSLIAKLRGADIYWWGHAWSSTSSRLGSMIRFRLMNFFNIILYTDEEIKLTKGLINKPVVALNNGLDIEAIRAKLKINFSKYDDDDGLNIAFIGRNTEKSKFDHLIQAVIGLDSNAKSNVNVHIIGNFNRDDIVKKHPLAESLNLICYGEMWNESEISAVLEGCHIFVYPGAVGLSLIHAFALGLPAILHDNRYNHMPEIGAFSPGVNGLTFSEGDVTSLTQNIKHCMNDKKTLKIYAQNAYQTVSQSFNTNDMAKRFINFIKDEK